MMLTRASTDEYVASFKPELMDAVFAWCNGASFSDITKARPPLVFASSSLTDESLPYR